MNYFNYCDLYCYNLLYAVGALLAHKMKQRKANIYEYWIEIKRLHRLCLQSTSTLKGQEVLFCPSPQVQDEIG